jgi:pimeloyl-ACP methyl ester carboxylesterase
MAKATNTIVFIPGLLCDRRVWEPVANQVWTLTNQPILHVEFDAEDSIADMAKTVLEKADGQLVLVGHSMGARVAIEATRFAAERIKGLALFDTGIHPLKPGELDKRKTIVELAFNQGMVALADTWLPPMLHEASRTNTHIFEPLYEMVIAKTPSLHERQIQALVNRPDAAHLLSRVTCPVLLGVGDGDRWSPVSQHLDMQALVPSASLVIISNAGHFAPLENTEETATHLLQWLLSL